MPSPSLHKFGLHCGRLPSRHLLLLLLFSWVVLLHATSSTAEPIKIQKTMKEELLPGTVITSLTSEPNFTKEVESSWKMNIDAKNTGHQLQFSILNAQKSPSLYFSVSEDGLVSIKKSVDRETVCSFKADCILNFEVAVMSFYSTFFLQVYFEINITDINDNPPEFTQPRFEINMPENVEAGKSFPLPTAFDRDTGPGNGVSDYTILQGKPFFGIKTAQTILNTTDVYLTVISSLNRESSPIYEILVGAKDGGLPSLTGTLTVEVHISDINDNFPVFKKDPYSINIAEDTKLNIPFLQVEATDADTGPNGELVYSFSPLQPPDNLAFFRINPTTGQIYLNQTIESKSGENIELIVIASDKGSPPKVSKTKVHITVADTVNSMPQITVNCLSSIKGVSEVSEKAEISKVVAHVSVRDPDSGVNGKTECSITPQEFELVPLEFEGTYKAVLRLPLDRELTNRYNVTVSCQDQGFPSLLAHEDFVVKVLDENDQVPTFSQRTYKASLYENNQPGVFITEMKVTDKDVGENAEIVFQVVGKNEKMFSVDDSGKMTALVPLDREQSEKIIITVRAMDKGEPPLSSSATVEITLMDMNDEAPEFSDPVYTLVVEEEQPEGKYIGIVSALDKDTGENSMVFYRFSSASQKGNFFSITSDGGVIKTNVILDREKINQYDLVVEAIDKGVPPLTGTAKVVIRVTDVNDNDPYFLYPQDANNTIMIPHTADKGSTIVNIIAKDADEGVNGEIMYSLHCINQSAPFNINSATGELKLIEALKPKDVGLYLMTIMASDKALQQQRGTQTPLSIEVVFDNSTLIVLAGTAGPSQEIITAIIITIITFILAVVIFFVIVCVRKRQIRKKKGMPNSASTSSTAKLQGGYYVAPGIRSSSSSVLAAKHEERTLLAESSRSNNYVVLIKEEPSGPAEVVKISRSGQAHALIDNSLLDHDQKDDGQFSTFRSQENILSPGIKYGSLSRKSNDTSSFVKKMNDTYDDVSCDDDSTSDSGRGGSDLEVNKEKARALAATPISVKSGISSRLSPLPQEKEKTFSTFRGESPNSFRFDSDSDTLTRNCQRPMFSIPSRAESSSQEQDQIVAGRYGARDFSGSFPRNRSLFSTQPYSTGIQNGFASLSESTRQPQRITPLSFTSPPATCHQYDTETDQSDSGSNSNSLSRRNHVPRLPPYQGIEFTHHAYGNRSSIVGYSNALYGGGLQQEYGQTRLPNGSTFNNYQNANESSYNYSDAYPSDYAGQDPSVTSGYNNVVSELQLSRPVSMDGEFELPPYPEENENVEEPDDIVDNFEIFPGYSRITPNRDEDQTALFKSKYESSA
ncbi:protocadherin-11 X-linked-like [Biomphalaria glabrata]|uniref:Protocadherin-11 X-linked-like n=1 Tax=Biomphalaria glabrata TaxID=6526 RepID=A0A9W3B1T0_BIOGL|nr:protocadherin-11 X-linked-like [Biomphalaria glabrata]XP_055893418.1 protocadherin-11 X-linked-like [Biomphalaria glabrata]XP_055893419.1 protocadherin-11 X-linked-like [Biomphalaria glabrata]XP_055893420.1 protocadherin-11 X-linked-like [Biomphalaria glabrata]XP_055893421.1 protocadherin-11 X-linked-like [Biomphalaria glabrata]XP_055893422.1 protocadherin-11 X-linked-like [Biomphalaria glabrata]